MKPEMDYRARTVDGSPNRDIQPDTKPQRTLDLLRKLRKAGPKAPADSSRDEPTTYARGPLADEPERPAPIIGGY